MTEQLVLTIVAATVGFVSAVLFCIGGFLNTSNKILLQSTPYWDFSVPVASSLAAQRAQYVIGALLLVFAFLLQVAAALASSTTPASLPSWLHAWSAIVFAVLVPTCLVAGGLSVLLYKTTMRKVLRLEEERRQKDETERGRLE
ncbi:MAG: hypothetical protein HRU77_03300 [Gammaproteobacteria bacterium]|nr:MAG: hypothetical protein HRU77_03300 [Gammaproteobacteria bacterium]